MSSRIQRSKTWCKNTHLVAEIRHSWWLFLKGFAVALCCLRSFLWVHEPVAPSLSLPLQSRFVSQAGGGYHSDKGIMRFPLAPRQYVRIFPHLFFKSYILPVRLGSGFEEGGKWTEQGGTMQPSGSKSRMEGADWFFLFFCLSLNTPPFAEAKKRK